MNFKYNLFLFISLLFLVAFFYLKKSNTTSNKHKETIHVGVSTDMAPFSYKQDDTIVGFDIDLITAIAQELNVNIKLRSMPLDALIPGLQLGTIKLAISAITPTPKYNKQLLLTSAYLEGNNPFLLITHRHNKDIKTLDDLIGKEVAVIENSAVEYYLLSKQEIITKPCTTPVDCFAVLQNNTTDALIMIQNIAKPLLDKPGNNFAIHEIPNTQADYAIAISKKHPELQASIQRVLDKFTKNKTLDNLKKKWHLS